ncbi:MAG: DUF1801 domain-containing protein [Ferruginibacter sp.]|nr:DUF1801 domain-containing protein [Ferruginibacter sp.]
MQSKATSINEYISLLPKDRQEAIKNLQKVIKKNIPKGFVECISYGMIGYVVPHSIYPAGYHCTPQLPLPFMNIASQKNFVAIYHMGIYGDKNLLDWFLTEYAKQSSKKIDMGKSCIRFKKMEDIPFQLIGELAAKITVQN